MLVFHSKNLYNHLFNIIFNRLITSHKFSSSFPAKSTTLNFKYEKIFTSIMTILSKINRQMKQVIFLQKCKRVGNNKLFRLTNTNFPYLNQEPHMSIRWILYSIISLKECRIGNSNKILNKILSKNITKWLRKTKSDLPRLETHYIKH